MSGLSDVLCCTHCGENLHTHNPLNLKPFLFYYLHAAFLCHQEAAGAITPSSGCTDLHEGNQRLCIAQTAPKAWLWSRLWAFCSAFMHVDQSVPLLPRLISAVSLPLSKYSFIHALTLHICPNSELILLCTVYTLSLVCPATICKNLCRTKELRLQSGHVQGQHTFKKVNNGPIWYI